MADDGSPLGKRELTKSQNRRAILDAAREVFGELGYEVATVRDIVRRTDLAAGTFYNYYRSKEEVFAALADEGARRFSPILKSIRAACGEDLDAFIRQALAAYFEFLAQEHGAWLARRPPDEPNPRVQGMTPEMQAVFAEARAAIEAALAAGHGAAGDVDYMTTSCIAVAREVGREMLRRRPLDVPGAAAFAHRMILGGIRAAAADIA